MSEKLITFETALLLKAKGYKVDRGKSHEYNPNHKFFINHRNGKYKSVNDYWYDTNQNRSQYIDDQKSFIEQPTQSELQTWLREEYNIYVCIDITITRRWYYSIYDLDAKRCAEIESKEFYSDSYEETFEQGLQEALKQIEL